MTAVANAIRRHSLATLMAQSAPVETDRRRHRTAAVDGAHVEYFRGIANPMASLLSAAMMLRWSFGLHKEADLLESSIAGLLAEGYRTADIAKPNDRSLNTRQVGDMIAGQVAG